MGFGRRRGPLVVIVSVAVLAAACSGGGSDAGPKPSTTTAPKAKATPAKTTLIDRYTAEIRDGGLTPERAANLFSATVAPLPGVTLPKGERGDVQSGTYATLQLLGVWDRLTDEQQQAAADLLGLDEAHAKTAGTVTADLAAADPGPEFFIPYVKAADKAIAAKLGQPPIGAFDVTVETGAASPPYADTTYFSKIDLFDHKYIDLERMLDACHINVYYGPKWVGASTDEILAILTHEVFHCYQQRSVGTLAKNLSVHPWVLEGEATWVMMELVPGAVFSALQDHWTRYVSTPQHRPLFTRDYDAVGFYGHIEDREGPEQVWPNLLPAVGAGVGGKDEAAFGQLLTGVEATVMDTWAASYFRSHPGIGGWDIQGPGKGNLPSFGAAPEALAIGPSQTKLLPRVDPYENGLTRLSSSADIVEVTVVRGNAALADSADLFSDVLRAGGTATLCFNPKGCECPAGTEGTPPKAAKVEPPVDIGLTGARTGGDAFVLGYSLEQWCKEPRRDPGEPPPPKKQDSTSGGGGGQSVGDPHLTTFDNRSYSFQAAGEFTLARSDDGTLDVQVRQEVGDETRAWTANTQVATKVGDTRITVSTPPKPPKGTDGSDVRDLSVLVDGKPVTGDPPHLEGGSLAAVSWGIGQGWSVAWDDGSTMDLQPAGQWGISVVLHPAEGLKGSVHGLLGDDDGDRTNDPADKDGTVLEDPPTYQRLNGQFADSWRILQADSLFDYGPGESTATFTDRTVPDPKAELSPEAKRRAEDLCKKKGITDPALLDQCTFDLAASDDASMLYGYVDHQRTLEFATGGSATTGEAEVHDVTVKRTSDQPELPFEAKKGEIVYIGGEAPGCTSDPHLAADLVLPDGSETAVSGDACAIGRFVIDQTGTYKVKLNTLNEGTGKVHVPITSVKADEVADAKAGEALSGTIGFRAEHDVYRFDAKAGQTLTTKSDTCKDPGISAELLGPDGTSITVAALCGYDQTELPDSGTYALVVNAQDSRAGDYAFTLAVS